ncbi:MAG: bifunctional diaminohydroxyphosphoribosylaminopyrimidine deaminase/5-amino-6-(5-phosphoribosylamino)uracil reductase RibD [Bacteroidota bacterium]
MRYFCSVNIDEKYMRRAIQLGKNALGKAAPNPMVGAVITHNEKIIGEGYTSPLGGPHAEVNAVNAIKDKTLLKSATLYVTLEPCSHYGRTPPCSDLIIANGIPNVVIGVKDPNPKVAGNGIKKLRNSGCNVKVGVLENECRSHHKRFLTFHEKKRPYILLKWAESSDGFIAPSEALRKKKPQPFWITHPYSRQLVHRWRSEEMAILVGTKTVLSDDPSLTVRDWQGKNPVRIVLDSELKVPGNAKVFNPAARTIVLTEKQKNTKANDHLTFEQLDFSGNLPQQVCNVLNKHEINSVLIEGGAQTLQTFIDSGYWDEARIFKGHSYFGEGVAAPSISGTRISKSSRTKDDLIFLQHD